MRGSFAFVLGLAAVIGVGAGCGGKELSGGSEAGTQPKCTTTPCPPPGGDDANDTDEQGPDSAMEDVSPPGDDGPTSTSDAPTSTTDAEGTCTLGAGSGTSGSNGFCSTNLTETCNGTVYQVSCSCPGATCSCSQMSGSTGGGSMSKYGGCGSDCSNMSDAFNACGFPSP